MKESELVKRHVQSMTRTTLVAIALVFLSAVTTAIHVNRQINHEKRQIDELKARIEILEELNR